MSKKPPKRPEHCPNRHEWLPNAYKRDVKPHGPEARERVRQALAEGKIIALLRTPSGERHEIDRRMWDKEPGAKKVYPRFEDGWMRMGLGLGTGLYTGRYVEGFVFVPQGKLSEAALAMMGPGKSKYEDWAARQALLKKVGKTWTDAAIEIAKEVGVDPVYLARETRRVRRERKKRESGETN